MKQRKIKFSFRSTLAAFLSLVLFSTQSLFAYNAEKSVCEQRRAAQPTNNRPSQHSQTLLAQLTAGSPLPSSLNGSAVLNPSTPALLKKLNITGATASTLSPEL